jgi:RNA polymerase sigma-70 factor (ECF subfamily)
LPDQSNIPGTYLSSPDNDSVSDKLRELIKDCIALDRSAQRIFYERYAPAVYNAIKRYVYQDEAAQEILNDSFYKIFTRLGQYSWQGPIEGWMRRIAINTLMDHRRKYLKHEKVNKAEVTEEDAYIDSNVVSNMSFKELVACTHKLPETHRMVFNLYVFEDMSHKEIGKNLEISEGNSRWILNDARKKLKEIILSSMK